MTTRFFGGKSCLLCGGVWKLDCFDFVCWYGLQIRYWVLTQKSQKNLKEVFENFVSKKPTLFGIGLVYGFGFHIQAIGFLLNSSYSIGF
jgi:hypothetical protein